MKKAMSQTIWIIMVIVIGLVSVLIVITMLNSTASKAKEGTEQPMVHGGNTIKIEMCKRICESCYKIDACVYWGEETGKGCMDEGVNVDCPYEGMNY